MINVLNHNIAAYLGLKYNDYAKIGLSINKTIYEFILISPDLKSDIDYNFEEFDKRVDKDLSGKTIKQIQKYLLKGYNIPDDFYPECILLCSGVMVYNGNGQPATALNVRPYCNLDFIDYMNIFTKHILSGTCIPYNEDVFLVTNANLLEYLNAIFCSYLYIYPNTAIGDFENVKAEDLIERISESIRTFLHYYQKMDNSEMFINYVQCFLNEIQSNEAINKHCKNYFISSN